MPANLSAIKDYAGTYLMGYFFIGAATGLTSFFVSPPVSRLAAGASILILICAAITLMSLAHRRLRDKTGYRSITDMIAAGDGGDA